MPHDADFADAHRRHWEDAELLYVHERWANADQLYGFSAECGLKTVMLNLNMPVNTTGKPTQQEHRKHVKELWSIFENFAKDRDGAQYLNLLPGDEPFKDWSADGRYAHRRDFGRAALEPHRDAARKIRQMVAAAAQDGNS